MTRIVFQKVSVKGKRRWKDEGGKWHQETKEFWQTVRVFCAPVWFRLNGLPRNYGRSFAGVCSHRVALNDRVLTNACVLDSDSGGGDFGC
jgi:hypothetical protein